MIKNKAINCRKYKIHWLSFFLLSHLNLSLLSLLQRERETKIIHNYAKVFHLFVLYFLTFKIVEESEIPVLVLDVSAKGLDLSMCYVTCPREFRPRGLKIKNENKCSVFQVSGKIH